MDFAWEETISMLNTYIFSTRGLHASMIIIYDERIFENKKIVKILYEATCWGCVRSL